jgi:hypothetical protein
VTWGTLEDRFEDDRTPTWYDDLFFDNAGFDLYDVNELDYFDPYEDDRLPISVGSGYYGEDDTYGSPFSRLDGGLDDFDW